MKKINLFYVIAVAAVLLVSCKPESETKTYIVDFEDVTLTDGIYNGSDLSGTPQKETAWGEEITNYYKDIVSGVAKFQNVYTNEWMSWKGFYFKQTDKETVGWEKSIRLCFRWCLGFKQFAVHLAKLWQLSKMNTEISKSCSTTLPMLPGYENGEYGGGNAKV